eukprot:1021948-Pyramimonas_sp.AAC.1
MSRSAQPRSSEPAPQRVGRHGLASRPMIAITEEALNASCFGRSWAAPPLGRVPPRAPLSSVEPLELS